MSSNETQNTCNECGTFIANGINVLGVHVKPDICENCEQHVRQRRAWREFEARLHQTNIPPEFWGFNRERGNTQLLDWAINVLPATLWLAGETGLGKTRVACRSVIVTMWRKGGSAWYMHCPTDAARLEDMRKYDNQSCSAYFKRMKVVTYLILDDIGLEKDAGSWWKGQLFGVLDYRCRRQMTTVCTTNSNRQELEAQYGVDRWAQMRRRIFEHGVKYPDTPNEPVTAGGDNYGDYWWHDL